MNRYDAIVLSVKHSLLFIGYSHSSFITMFVMYNIIYFLEYTNNTSTSSALLNSILKNRRKAVCQESTHDLILYYIR
jgi:hypothetical protein